MILRYSLFFVLVAAVITVAASTNKPIPQASKRSMPYTDQVDRSKSIKFSHKFHIEQAGAECTSCHGAASTSKSSGDNLLGTKADCASCHDVEDTDECLKCHVSLESAGPFENPARELIFSHEAHVTAQDMKCEDCHTGLEAVDYASGANLPSMTTCNTCHNDMKVTNACESCHTDFVTLVPPDHERSDFIRNHREVVRLGALDASCQTCHREDTFCQDCHQPAGLKTFGTRDRAVDPSARRWTKDSPDQMKLQSVHELNYRFTHGIDAKSRAAECQSCHEPQTFCADCHSAGGNITQPRFKPASHAVPGFTTLGPGSGGGLHAEEARRDIESCASCHNVEGQDPTCFTCHTETGRVR